MVIGLHIDICRLKFTYDVDSFSRMGFAFWFDIREEVEWTRWARVIRHLGLCRKSTCCPRSLLQRLL
ncbi:hypothetical protein BpHYR1_014654 [Brachionus plicatilis]|uniref:Uncharacterized protein n=1 Tax=Brachionus plicatilis TaxID=10195 RepID=A0A3M7R2A9_BRAPC|nr:hypothetical protein BpHYR1_014654 [Brachionus plicatilis]